MGKNISKTGFTLFEVIVVMIIISIIVGVSLKLAKTKLNNIKSYTYYYAYKTLSTAASKMLFNFNTNNDDVYMLTANNGTCTEGYQIRTVDGDQTCVPTPITIPRRGQNFCQLFASYANTRTDSFDDEKECSGDTFAGNINNEVSFANMRPDIVLRNGMRMYNLSTDPYEELAPLANNSNGRVYYADNDVEMDIDTTGYIVFLDIDGTSGTSTLWQDVFPFYITMSGKVIPAFRNNTGGSSKEYLSVSAYNEIVNDSGRRINWLIKSVSFREAACASGYIKADTPYCLQDLQLPAIGLNAECTAADSDCRINVISPIKWFN